jgi:hypothetical protein
VTGHRVLTRPLRGAMAAFIVPLAAVAQEPARTGLSGELGGGGFLSRVSCTSCEDVTTGSAAGVLVRVGMAIQDNVTLGLELVGQSSETFGLDLAGNDLFIESANVSAIVLWFPWRSGVWVKGGVGAASGTVTVQPKDEAPVEAGGTGVGLTGGIGLDVPILSRLSISVGIGAWISAIGDILLPTATVDDVIGSSYGLTLGFTLR